MKLKVTTIIPQGAVAYHVFNGVIDDYMLLGKNQGGYHKKPVQELIDHGWSFVCAKQEFKKGDKCNYKPDKTTPPVSPSSSTLDVLKTNMIPLSGLQCPYCKHHLHAKVTMLAQVELS
jgi:hypothetical protein